MTCRFRSHYGSRTTSSGVCTWMSDHGTPRDVGNTWCTRHTAKIGGVCHSHHQNTPPFTATKCDWSLELEEKRKLKLYAVHYAVSLLRCHEMFWSISRWYDSFSRRFLVLSCITRRGTHWKEGQRTATLDVHPLLVVGEFFDPLTILHDRRLLCNRSSRALAILYSISN